MFRVVSCSLLLAACGTVQASSLRPNQPEGSVQLRAVQAPAEQVLGSVTLEGSQLGELALQFQERVRALGGRVGVIDKVATHFTERDQAEDYTYDCGMPKAPRRCVGHRTRQVEVMTLELSGRAFR